MEKLLNKITLGDSMERLESITSQNIFNFGD